MATIVLGCDDNGVNDAEYQSTVAKILEEAGNTVEKCAIEPNAFASYSDGSNGKDPNGKIGVYLIAAGTYSIADATYGTSKFKYNYFGIRPECSPGWECSDFDTKPIGADADCPGWLCAKIAGNSFKKINEIVKEKSMVVTGENAEEMGKNLVKAMGGEYNEDGEDSTGSTIKDALKQAVSGDGTVGWDGEAEIRIVEDTVYVNKIPDPATTELVANEYENVIYDSVTITDLNPQTPNKITMSYGGQTLAIQDDWMISRFEETPTEVEPDEFVTNQSEAEAFLRRNWGKVRRDDGRQVELKVEADSQWKVGTWVRVFLPSFFIDDYMYIIRASHEEDGTGNWLVGLTLADYPPSFGLYTGGSSEEEEEDEDTEDTDTDTEDSENTEEETTE